jgi:hypothetical protein
MMQSALEEKEGGEPMMLRHEQEMGSVSGGLSENRIDPSIGNHGECLLVSHTS